MTDTKEKLINLMIEAKKADTEDAPFSEFLADFMILNGVTVRQSKPCRLCECDKIHILVITKEPEQLFSFSTDETGLMFCPMCGRDLRGIK